MSEIVNLYWVNVVDKPYGYFVFASTANKAKTLCVYHNSDDEEYINLRAYIIARSVGGANNIVVDSSDDKDYSRVLATGNKYYDEE
jgi:hypothetical protein